MMLLRGHLSLSLFLVTLLHKTFDNHDNNKINHEIYWQRIISDYVVDINHVFQPTVYAEQKSLFVLTKGYLSYELLFFQVKIKCSCGNRESMVTCQSLDNKEFKRSVRVQKVKHT